MSEEKVYASPDIYVDGKEYFAACAEGRLLVKKCADCGEFHFYPRVLCPYCFSDKTEWVQSTGRGKLYSYSTLRVAKPPYTIAYVTLDEGVTMLTNLVDCDVEKLAINQAMKVVFKPTKDGQPVPFFTPA